MKKSYYSKNPKLTKKISKKSSKKSSIRQPHNPKSSIKSKSHQSLSISFLSFAFLILVLLIIPGKNFWLFFHNSLFGLFSKCSFFLPPLFLYISYAIDSKKFNSSINSLIYPSFVLFLLICILSHLFFCHSLFDNYNFLNFISSAFIDGINKNGGGAIAAFFVWPLLSLLGFGGSLALVSILIFSLIMFISKTTISDLLKVASSPAKKIESIYSHKQIQKQNIQNFNLPLSDISSIPSNTKNLPPKPDKIDNSNIPIPEPNINFFEFNDLNDIQTQNSKTNQTIKSSVPLSTIISSQDDQTESKHIKKNIETKNSNNDNIDNFFKTKMNNISPVKPIQSKPLTPSTLSLNTLSTQNIDKSSTLSYIFPPIELLNDPPVYDNDYDPDELKTTAQILVDTLKSFGVSTQLLDLSRGPTVTRYELKPSAGVKISKITGLTDDIALNLAAAGIRIEAPIPNKAAVGIEVPNKSVSIVSIKEIISSQIFIKNKSPLCVALGKDISGNISVTDLSKMPHLLIAGSTGSGKSVCINSLIVSLIFKSSPEKVKLLLIDPKVVELGVYNNIPHLLLPVVTDPKKAAGALKWAVGEMLKRYNIFAESGVRDIGGYNRLAKNNKDFQPLPNIVIIIDELADLMMVAPNEIEDSICRLAQMARAAGMYLIIATQRPSVDVITGIIKANIPSRIAFAVSSQIDSRTIIDSSGAEKLLGRGDMLFLPMGAQKSIRIQGCFVSDSEIENVVSFIKQSNQSNYDNDISSEIDRLSLSDKPSKNSSYGDQIDDELLPKAIECAIENGEISTSFLQRKLKLGYSRAARLIDEMESRGIVGPKEGSKPRQTLISKQQWIEMDLNSNSNLT